MDVLNAFITSALLIVITIAFYVCFIEISNII
jgi:hypothetical protein